MVNLQNSRKALFCLCFWQEEVVGMTLVTDTCLGTTLSLGCSFFMGSFSIIFQSLFISRSKENRKIIMNLCQNSRTFSLLGQHRHLGPTGTDRTKDDCQTSDDIPNPFVSQSHLVRFILVSLKQSSFYHHTPVSYSALSIHVSLWQNCPLQRSHLG